jgi:hypothetical protein
MAKKYDSITVNVTEHSGSRSVYLVAPSLGASP